MVLKRYPKETMYLCVHKQNIFLTRRKFKIYILKNDSPGNVNISFCFGLFRLVFFIFILFLLLNTQVLCYALSCVYFPLSELYVRKSFSPDFELFLLSFVFFLCARVLIFLPFLVCKVFLSKKK